MPRRAMRCVARCAVSVSLTLIEPLREPIRPMIARSVLVRPAPFLPSSVTTSPSSTWKSTPCSTCDSPYQAFRPLISRNGVVISVRSREFGQRRAALEHGDGIGNGGDHAHVVFHHQDRAVGRHLLDELADAVDILDAH